MDDKQATEIAAALASTEKPTYARLARAATVATTAGVRLRVAVISLAGAYVGWRLVAHFPGLSIPPAIGAAVVGLLAAAVVPVAGPNNGFRPTPLDGDD